ncbi:MAG: hypothetical protein LBS95_00390 [Mycoplasmataceae bacterium]|jgi:hypothetical protein|nr:hypothetical protein [Mycoplasmataceae bacterium]
MIFEVGVLFLGFMYVVSKYLDLMLQFAQYNDEKRREENEKKIPECVKHLYN